VQSSSQIVATNKPTSSFFTARCPSCRPTNSVKALKGKISHSMDLLTPSSPGGLPTLSLTTEVTTIWCCINSIVVIIIIKLIFVGDGRNVCMSRKTRADCRQQRLQPMTSVLPWLWDSRMNVKWKTSFRWRFRHRWMKYRLTLCHLSSTP